MEGLYFQRRWWGGDSHSLCGQFIHLLLGLQHLGCSVNSHCQCPSMRIFLWTHLGCLSHWRCTKCVLLSVSCINRIWRETCCPTESASTDHLLFEEAVNFPQKEASCYIAMLSCVSMQFFSYSVKINTSFIAGEVLAHWFCGQSPSILSAHSYSI